MSAYSVAVLADSPQAYWRLGQTSGTSITDSSGNGRTGTASSSLPPGGATSLLAADVADGALRFDPTATAGPIRVNTTYSFAQSPMTAEFWIKPTDLSPPSGYGMPVTCAGADGNGWSVYFPATTGVWHFLCQNGTDATFTATAATGVTQHIVFAVSTISTVSLYINGSFQQAITTGGIAATSSNVCIGEQGDSTHPCNAVIDEVALYSTELVSGTIAAHYAAGVTSAAAQQRMALTGVGA